MCLQLCHATATCEIINLLLPCLVCVSKLISDTVLSVLLRVWDVHGINAAHLPSYCLES